MNNIESPNLILHACDTKLLELAIRGNKELEGHLGVSVPENWTEFGTRALHFALEKLKTANEDAGWWTYLPVHKVDNKLIGSCGYKGGPDSKGMVEIGYEIMKPYRNKGLATELVESLVKNAFSFATVNVIQAHTLGEENASTRVLHKNKFIKTGQIEDARHGQLWKWELRRSS